MSVKSLIAALAIVAAMPLAAHAGTCAGNQVRGASGTWETISPVAGLKSFGSSGDCSSFAAASTSDEVKVVGTPGADAGLGRSMTARSALSTTTSAVFGVSSLGAGSLGLASRSSRTASAVAGGEQEAVMLLVLGIGLLGWVARRTRSRS